MLIAYTYEGNNNKYFLERRSIDARGRMGEGHPVTVEFMNELVRNYSEAHSGTPHGRLPSNLLYADTRKGSERYVWYNPPGKRMMYFVGGLGIENAEYHLPGIIYEARGTRLDVYACKEDRPGMETALYANLLEYWERKFWLTEFSQLGGHGNPTKSNLVLVTKAARDKPFDLKELKPLKNLKLKDILE